LSECSSVTVTLLAGPPAVSEAARLWLPMVAASCGADTGSAEIEATVPEMVSEPSPLSPVGVTRTLSPAVTAFVSAAGSVPTASSGAVGLASRATTSPVCSASPGEALRPLI
jgi:hypothetical protein